MKILIIDCTIEPDSYGSLDLQKYARRAPGGATIHVRRAPEGDLPRDPRAYDRIIVSGSKTSATEEAPWIDELQGFIRATLDDGKPYLGVCFGHQMLVRTLGGLHTVGKAKLGEVGWTKIEVIGESPLLKGLSKSFYSFSSHFDEVKELPRGFRNLARSSACAVQAVQFEERPVFGIQFHPERDASGSEKTFAWAQKRLKAKTMDPRALLGAGTGARFYDAQVADKLFGNFLSIK